MPQGTNSGTQQTGEAATSLHDAVKGAFEKEGIDGDAALEVTNEGETKVTKKEPTSETKKEDAVEEPTDETFEIDASQEEIGHALALFRGLADPKSRDGYLKQIIDKSGYKVDTPQQQTQLVDDLITIFKEELGDSFDLVSGDKLAKAVERAVESRTKKILDPVLARIKASEEHQQRELANSEMAALWTRHKIADKDRAKVADAMMKKMQVMAPGEGASAAGYLDDIYSLVNRDMEKARAVSTTVRRIKENAKDANTASGGNEGDDNRIKKASRLPSISESVAAAFRNEKLED